MRKLYKEYFQKSKVFLYPILGLERGISTVPSGTYIAWDKLIEPSDQKLITVYTCTDHQDYPDFKKNILLQHDFLIDIRVGENNEHIYVFDLLAIGSDYQYFLSGKYSSMSDEVKELILTFFDGDRRTLEYVESYLFPEDFFEDYSKLLNVDIDIIKDVGELCAPPDLLKETLKTTIKRS